VRFVDTNVLLHAISKAEEELPKTEIALGILDNEDLALSVQVLQEFYVQATRKTRTDPITHAQATGLIESWLRYPVKDIDVALMKAALETSRRFRISYWDAAVIEAARALGCGIVLSEDLSDGQDYGGVVVVNPFRTAA